MYDEYETVKKELGDIVICFNLLDMVVAMSIWSILGIGMKDQKAGKAITNELMFVQRINMLNRLVSEVMPADKKSKFKEIYEHLKSCNRDRNKYIHSLWFLGTPDPSIYDTRKEFTRSGLYDATKAFSSGSYENLEKFKQEILSATGEMSSFLHDILEVKGLLSGEKGVE